jgi:hypothetical protein
VRDCARRWRGRLEGCSRTRPACLRTVRISKTARACVSSRERRWRTHDLVGRTGKLVLECLQGVSEDDLGRSIERGRIEGSNAIPVSCHRSASDRRQRARDGCATAPQREPRRPERRDTPDMINVVVKGGERGGAEYDSGHVGIGRPEAGRLKRRRQPTYDTRNQRAHLQYASHRPPCQRPRLECLLAVEEERLAVAHRVVQP